jgi:hypothetical protein
MPSLEELSFQVESLKARNARVESDKAWETSWFRRVLILLFTYLAVALYLNAIGVLNPWLNAIVPALGFWLSTLALPWAKGFWLAHFYRKR